MCCGAHLEGHRPFAQGGGGHGLLGHALTRRIRQLDTYIAFLFKFRIKRVSAYLVNDFGYLGRYIASSLGMSARNIPLAQSQSFCFPQILDAMPDSSLSPRVLPPPSDPEKEHFFWTKASRGLGRPTCEPRPPVSYCSQADSGARCLGGTGTERWRAAQRENKKRRKNGRGHSLW